MKRFPFIAAYWRAEFPSIYAWVMEFERLYYDRIALRKG